MLVRLITVPAVIAEAWLPPLGIAQLAAILKANGIGVHCLDLNPDCGHGAWIPDDIIVAEPAGRGAQLLRDRFPAPLADWADAALENGPDLIGISVLYRSMVVPALALARLIHERKPGVMIVLGGPVFPPSNQALVEQLLADGSVAAIVAGDGDQAIVDLAAAASRQRSLEEIPGLWLCRDGACGLTAPGAGIDPAALPFPEYGDFQLARYAPEGPRRLSLQASRGCVNACTFCNSRKVSPGFRHRAARRVFEEIRAARERYGIERFEFADNLINGNPAALQELCGLCAALPRPVTLTGFVSLLPTVDDELLDLMRAAGFREVLLAVETPATRVRADMGKWSDTAAVSRIVRGAVRRGLHPRLYLMHSFPTERADDFAMLLHFLDGYAAADFIAVGCWPFRLAQIQPGLLDREFIERFGLVLDPGDGYDPSNPRLVFGREPRWHTALVNDTVRRQRQQQVDDRLRAWRARGSPAVSAGP